MSKFVILGGGWSGIVSAFELKRRFPSAEVIVLEKSDTPGGLLRTVIIRGHVFDIGGNHFIFSRNKVILNKILSLLGRNVVKNQRRAYVLLDSLFIPYPFENGLYALPLEERAEALINYLETLLARDRDFTPKTFKDWICYFFGKWIAEKYLIPYNEKIWKRPLEEIDVDWVYTPGRLPIPDWKEVVKSAIGITTVGYAEENIFYYPRQGGIQALFNAIAKKAENLGVMVVNNVDVCKIKKSGNKWLVNDKFRGEKLISTIPLKELVKALDAPEEIIKASEELDYNRFVVIGLALKKDAPRQHWIYVPDKKIVFHKYTWVSNYSPQNSPPGESTIIAEITLSPRTKVNREKLIDKVVSGLEDLGVIKSSEVLFSKLWFHEYGYPIYRKGYKERYKVIADWLKEQNIVSIGRWGMWHYWNMDKIYEEVLKAINKRA